VALTTFEGLFGERYGDGTPMVLALHGWGRDHTDFSESLRDIPSISIDLPGFGATPAPPAPIGSAGYADIVGPVLGIFDTPPLVVGHSFGGRVAVQLAARQLVSGLVLIGTPLLRVGPGKKPPLRYRMTKRFGFLLGAERLEAARRRYGSADYRASTGVMRDVLVAAVNESYGEVLPSLACPVHLLWGERDTEVPVAVAEAALGLLPHGRLRVLPEVGHLVPTAAPAAVRAEIEEAL